MERWHRLRDPIATIVFAALTLAVSLGWIPEDVDRGVVLEVLTAAMTIAAAFGTYAEKKRGSNASE